MQWFLFCADYFDKKRPDDAFEAEVRAVEALGLPYALLDFEALVHEGKATKALRHLPPIDGSALVIYRGWMLSPAHYALLYEALAARHLRLINEPAAYEYGHYLPRSYELIAPHTPRTVWFEGATLPPRDELADKLAPFGAQPLIVKDWVKSRKHEWAEACYIPAANDLAAVERVAGTFLQRQGEELARGLVFREWVPFAPLGPHSRSGMPLTQEFRYFCLDGSPFYVAPYWDEGAYGTLTPPVNPFPTLLRQVRSRFFTLDVARTEAGAWLIVELGDGQVSSLPEPAASSAFYRALVAALPA